MELVNATRMLAGYTMGVDPSGRENLVVVIKGTFRIPPEPGASLQLHEKQLPLVMADVFHGEPGFSAPKYEVDFALGKARCDVLMNACAKAPGGRPVERVAVGIRVGAWSKSFAVVGDREWVSRSGGVRATPPRPFVSMPISYGRAYGGIDSRHADPAKHAAFMRNPVGCGFHEHLESEWLDGSALPNTEELDRPVIHPRGGYAPMAFGPIGRNWEPRYRFAGTYDQHWLDEVFPFLPEDFDERYYQAAPEDQQMPLPDRPLEVVLAGVSAEGVRRFMLPHFDAPVHVFPKRGKREDSLARLDTILVEPDADTVVLTWRLTRPLRRDLFDLSEVLVGRKGHEWWQARHEAGPSTMIGTDARSLSPERQA